MNNTNDPTRRTFLKSSAAAVAGTALAGTIARTAHAAGSDEIKFCLVGCGGRGTGAATNIMNTKGNVTQEQLPNHDKSAGLLASACSPFYLCDAVFFCKYRLSGTPG